MSANFKQKGRRLPTTVGVRKLDYSDCPFVWYQNICSALFGFVTKHVCNRQTDGGRDGQNYDSQDRASIAASRGKNAASSDEMRGASQFLCSWTFRVIIIIRSAHCATQPRILMFAR